MATFQAEVTQEGWKVTIDTKPEDSEAQIIAVHNTAGRFIEIRAKLEAQSPTNLDYVYGIPDPIKEAIQKANGETEAESIQD